MTEAAAGAPGGGITSAGKLSYVQIPAIDAEVSASFYRDVFGWTIRGTPEHRSFADASGELIGAWITGRAIHEVPGILPYVYVTGLDAALDRVKAHGGAIVKGPYQEGDLWVAHFRDPAGNVIGVWQMGGR